MRSTAALIGILMFAVGCASSGRSKSADTVSGITTIEQEFGIAADQLQKTIDSLGGVVEAGSNLNAAYDKFSADLEDLDGKVQSLRDRSIAMQANRDAYLKHWLEQTSKITNEDLKKQAEARRAQLMTDFMDLNGKGAAVKKAYAPIQASLHDCQRFLEADLNPAGAKALSGELEKIKQGHKELEAAGKEYRAQLKVIVDKLAIPAPAPEMKPESKTPAEAPKK